MAFILKSEERKKKKKKESTNTWKNWPISNKCWLLTFYPQLQGLKSLTHVESWEHLFRVRWCSSNRQEASDSTTHLFTGPDSRSGWQPRHWLHLNDVGVHSDGWEPCGQIQAICRAHQTPLGLRRVQMWHYFKLPWGRIFLLIFCLFFSFVLQCY